MTSENYNSLSKQEAIQQLRKTIDQIETIIQQLNNTSITELPSSSTIESLTKTTTELEEIITQKSATKNETETLIESEELPLDNNDKKETITIQPESTATETISQVSPAEKTKLESPELPPNPILNNQQTSKNNKRNLLIAVAIFVITIIPLSWEFFVVQKNSAVVSPDVAQTLVENNTDSTENQDVIEQAEPTTEDYIAETIPPTTEQITKANPEVPSELLVEKKPQKVAIKTIKAPKNLTSEQNLIASIEDKERELVERYTNDLVTLIEPNFEDSIVTVTVADNWYDMALSKQDEISEEILKKSRQLEFNKLRIIDSQNNLIARSPVVGKNIVILRRTI